MLKFGALGLLGVAVYAATICGIIYFIFWCLREFGILAALGVT